MEFCLYIIFNFISFMLCFVVLTWETPLLSTGVSKINITSNRLEVALKTHDLSPTVHITTGKSSEIP